MKNKTIAMAGALLIGGLLTFNSVAFADTTDTTTANQPQKFEQIREKLQGKMGGFRERGQMGMKIHQKLDWSTKLKELVAEGTITQATADKIQAYTSEQQAAMKAEMEKIKAMTDAERKAYFESKKTDSFKRIDLFSSMVEKGVITQAEADAITSKLHDIQQTKMQENVKASLDKLVTSNTITQDQATKIIDYMTKQQAERAAEMEKVKAMTEEERDAYFKNNIKNRTNMLEQLVTDNVLTQEQADAVAKALHPKGFEKGFGKGMIKGLRN